MPPIVISLLAAGLLVPGAGVAQGAAVPDRVQVLQARRLEHGVALKWAPAVTGARPTGYQVTVGAGRWKATKRERFQVRGLKAGRPYRVSIRGVRRGSAGPAVVIRVFPFS